MPAPIVVFFAACAGLGLATRHGMKLYQRGVLKMPQMSAAKSYYKGGFQATMTREEAARILGVRQTAQSEKIVAAHRKIMMLNHPDLGGSPYMATKINEAKTMLVGDKKSGKQ